MQSGKFKMVQWDMKRSWFKGRGELKM